MQLITLSDVGKAGIEAYAKIAKLAGRQFLRSVRPIFGADEFERLYLIGSCILVKVNGRPFLLTAAHVIDHHHNAPLFIGVGGKTHEIVGEYHATKAPDGDRNKDHYDFAFWHLPTNFSEQLGNDRFIENWEISENRGTLDGRQFMAMGYPLSRNKNIPRQGRHVTPRAWSYQGVHTENSQLASHLGVSGDEHFFLKATKRAGDYSGHVTQAIEPRGASGGALVDLGMPTLADLSPESTFRGRLAGIFIERHSKFQSMVFVRIEVALQAIRAKFPSDPQEVDN